MADTKISALSAVVTPAGTDEFGVNQAATSKKATLAQIATFVNTAPVWTAGTATAGTWPILSSGTVLTAPVAGAWEFDGKAFYLTPVASSRHVNVTEQFIASTATRTMSSNTSLQAIFTSPASGTLTLPGSTSYFFEAFLNVNTMSATSGNFGFSIVGGGTATFTSAAWFAHGLDATTQTTGAAIGGISSAASAQTGDIFTAATGTAAHVFIKGIFRINGAGTIIPSIQLTSANAAVIGVNTYFRCWPIGSNTVVSVGNWT